MVAASWCFKRRRDSGSKENTKSWHVGCERDLPCLVFGLVMDSGASWFQLINKGTRPPSSFLSFFRLKIIKSIKYVT